MGNHKRYVHMTFQLLTKSYQIKRERNKFHFPCDLCGKFPINQILKENKHVWLKCVKPFKRKQSLHLQLKKHVLEEDFHCYHY